MSLLVERNEMTNDEKLVTREKVFAAADKLKAEGKRVSYRKVTVLLGGGSPEDVLFYLREWWAEQGKATEPAGAAEEFPPGIETTFRDGLGKLKTAIRETLKREFDVERAAMSERVHSMTLERDLDRRRGLLRVERTRVGRKNKNTTKTHRPRDLELLERAAAVLQRQRARTELAGGAIFHNPTTGKPWADEQVQRRYFEAAVKRLEIRYRAQKQTRHTFATVCLMAGANPAWVARQLGHASSKMFFEVYSRWIEELTRGWSEARWKPGSGRS
jgi:hypothetical protein